MKKILIADDEQEIIELMTLYLERENYEVFGAYDGFSALDILKEGAIDIAIIDIMMPNMDGYQLIKKIREKYKIPVIVMSAKSEISDKILGLELGADDYITKPCDPLEVMARVKAQLRRCSEFNCNEEKDTETIVVGELKLDTSCCVIYKGDKPISITSTEYKLLLLLMGNPKKVFTKKQIFESVWNEPFYGDDNTIMVHISKLRDKIEEDSKNPVYLKTIRGLGYKFESKK
ncbi:MULTISPECIES: response regulator transcription factor [Clostridium]|uniref:Stage 0 sporulation protein A homolog n=2 Tax=Clostridium TaxID=1485 RepID=D8GSZ1_CLOLD|nr:MULTISPECIES: response regulator transcription factor [Clostridium]ADK14561.1 predicted two-component response regulator [Clostridium ljungdahlii DSM 13528]ALU37938.1 Two component transcriptional regulator winged helix family [Clostridium autoethanogenum DSM 10061]OAA85798.1 Alkaline phosphatase synthesis transcriptional regulatory protein PhoP [Clostridium ljungdahlii DSM 13528]OVY50702.1 Alkaline phosphatase synthesis transcriptional regulatory protein PhoP [Clostridium autoethanogenum]R